MSRKMIAIIDEPDDCFDCPLLDRGYGLRFKCPVSNQWMDSIDLTKRPDWCPLRPVTEKMEVPSFDNSVKAKDENDEEVGVYMYDRGIYRGYNICIDEILGD